MKLKSGKDWNPSEEAIEEWKGAYEKVDVEQELKKMATWCEANPAKRKTPSGVMKFCNSWLGRAQEQGGSSGSPSSYKKYKDPDSLRAKTLDMQLTDVTWITDPEQLMQMKHYYINLRGYYYDGEFRASL
tara:strand:- start:137 stop:526 length:390 start_codon:yes stop_codon:yes gene_type:complete